MPAIFQSLIQSNFGGDHGNFEAVINEGDTLVHWWRDNDIEGLRWKFGVTIVPAGVAGAGAIIQSDFGSGDHGNFEVVVPLRVADGRSELWHFFRDNSAVALPWRCAQRVADNVTGPGALIQSDFGSGDHGNFEVLVPEGRRLSHFFHDNSDVALPWRRGQFVTESLAGWASLIRSDFPEVASDHKNFEVLLEECDGSVIGYWHPNVNVAFPWLWDKPVIPRRYRVLLPDTRKIVQLTGEFDRQGWNGVGTPLPAHNQTESRFRIRGCDLGSSFVHRDRTYFLFGDTWRVNQTDEEVNLDSIAYTTDTNPDDGLDLTFLNRPPLIHPPVPQREFNVPLDGVSVNDSMFVFFSTDHYMADAASLMGRSVLTRSTNEGLDFDLLYEFSRDKFINVSVERVTLEEIDDEAVGAGTRDVLCVWGSGRYRSSDVYLAILPVAELMTGRGRRFYAGSEGRHVWSSDERDAAPLFCSGCVGELSARWNPFLKRFLLTYNNAGNPRGIILHAAPKPWGPWTHEPVMVFDPGHRAPDLDPNDPCLGDGYGKFMHVPWNWTFPKKCDYVHDDIVDGSIEERQDKWGAEYGPYQIGHMAKGSPEEWTQLYFVMSTWNPYQVVLMTTKLSVDVLGQVERTGTRTAVFPRLEIHGKTPF